MKLIKQFPGITFLSLFLLLISVTTTLPVQAKEPYAFPEFTQISEQEWLNSKPLSRKDLIGKVTLVDFWTYGCWNCYRSFPWLHGIEMQNKSKGFQVIGIHSPEFDHEKIHGNIKQKIKKFNITNPVMVDNDMAFWKRMKNRYWPAYYLVDKKGRVRGSFIGETHKGDPQAIEVEAMIAKLLTE